MAKSKIRLLEEELEKSLQQAKDLEDGACDAVNKYERLAGLVQDVWIAEVREYHHQYQQEHEAPMPINWLSDIRDTLRQLRESNDF